MNCSNCQNPIQEGDKVCAKCGKEMVLSRGLRIFWIMLLTLDVISAPLIVIGVVILSITGIIFNDSGVDHPVRSFFVVGMLIAILCVALCVASFVLFFKKKAKLGIALAAISALPIILVFLYVVLGSYMSGISRERSSVRREKWMVCLNKERAKQPDLFGLSRQDYANAKKNREFNLKYNAENDKVIAICRHLEP